MKNICLGRSEGHPRGVNDREILGYGLALCALADRNCGERLVKLFQLPADGTKELRQRFLRGCWWNNQVVVVLTPIVSLMIAVVYHGPKGVGQGLANGNQLRHLEVPSHHALLTPKRAQQGTEFGDILFQLLE